MGAAIFFRFVPVCLKGEMNRNGQKETQFTNIERRHSYGFYSPPGLPKVLFLVAMGDWATANIFPCAGNYF